MPKCYSEIQSSAGKWKLEMMMSDDAGETFSKDFLYFPYINKLFLHLKNNSNSLILPNSLTCFQIH